MEGPEDRTEDLGLPMREPNGELHAATDGSGGYLEYGFVAEFYDVVYGGRDDIDFYVDVSAQEDGPVLELACGTGRILIPLARDGATITGLDLSPSMLATCRRKLEEEPAEVRSRVDLIEGDMRDFDIGREFALITIPFRAFQHLLTVEDQLSCLAAVTRHLRSDGLFILDLFNPSMPALVDEARFEWNVEPELLLPDGRWFQRSYRVRERDWSGQVQDIEMAYDVIQHDGQKERLIHRFPMRYLFRYEAEHLLARAGFVVESVLGDFSGNAFGTSYPGELILMARKAQAAP